MAGCFATCLFFAPCYTRFYALKLRTLNNLNSITDSLSQPKNFMSLVLLVSNGLKPRTRNRLVKYVSNGLKYVLLIDLIKNGRLFNLPFFRATASKHEVLPTLKVLRVRLKHRLFLFPLKSFCKQKSFGEHIITVISSAVEKSRNTKSILTKYAN